MAYFNPARPITVRVEASYHEVLSAGLFQESEKGLRDYVLLKQQKRNKWSIAFEPAFYIIYRVDGSSIAARRITDGKEVYCDVSKFKLVNAVIQNLDETNTVIYNIESDPVDWRENRLLNTSQEDSERKLP